MGKKGLSNGAKRVVSTATEDALLEVRTELTADPEDARLTVDGAIVDDTGKINTSAYEDLHTWYAGEPPPNVHPRPEYPGVHHGEDVPKGLRIWDDLRAGCTDKDGAGWIVARSRKNEKKKEKWFNIRTTGSWRLAFRLARLQQDIWERRGGPGYNQRVPSTAGTPQGSPRLTVTDAVTAGAGDDGDDDQGDDELEILPAGEVSTPQKAGRAATPSADDSLAAPASSRKRPKAKASPGATAPKQQRQQQRQQQQQLQQVQEQEQPAQKKSILGADAVSGSLRLQQILAARRAQEEAAATGPASSSTSR